jgi:hypothetical protein
MGGSKSSSGPSGLQSQRVGIQNQLGKSLYAQGQGIFNEVNPTLEGELNNPLTAEEQGALTQTAMQPAASAFDAARANAAQRAARTRNPAGLLESEEQLAQKAGEGASTAAENALVQGMNIAQQRRNAAAMQLGQMYGISEEAMARLLGGLPSGQSSGFGFHL